MNDTSDKMYRQRSLGLTLMEMLIIMTIVLSLTYFLQKIYRQSDHVVERTLSSFSFQERQAYLYQKILNDWDSSFIGQNKISSHPQIKAVEISKENHFKFLIHKKTFSSKKHHRHPAETGLYYVEYRLAPSERGSRLERVLYPVEKRDILDNQRWKYSNLVAETLVEASSDWGGVESFQFFIKKDSLELRLVQKKNGQEFIFFHRWIRSVT